MKGEKSVEVIKLANKLNISSWILSLLLTLKLSASIKVPWRGAKRSNGREGSAATYRKLSSLSQQLDNHSLTNFTLIHTPEKNMAGWTLKKVHFSLSTFPVLSCSDSIIIDLSSCSLCSFPNAADDDTLTPRRCLSSDQWVKWFKSWEREKTSLEFGWYWFFFLSNSPYLWYCKLNVQIETLSVDLFKPGWRCEWISVEEKMFRVCGHISLVVANVMSCSNINNFHSFIHMLRAILMGLTRRIR